MIWLPDMDLNHDKQIQSLLCYRYTIGQTDASGKLENFAGQSSQQASSTASGLNGFDARPHPCPLPQERENRLPAVGDTDITDYCGRLGANSREAATAIVTAKFS